MLDQLQDSWNNLLEKLNGWLDSAITALPNIILSAIVMVVAYMISGYIKKYLRKLLGRVTKNGTLINIGANIATTVFMIFALLLVLSIMDLDQALTSLLAGAGIVGLAVGLALQDPIVNLFSGVMMSVKSYYKEGDLIETNGYFGKITGITLRSTILLQPDGQEVIIPNKDVLQNPLTNYSHNGRRRIDVSCGVAYGDDLDKAASIVQKAIEEELELKDSAPVEVFFGEFGDSSINFTLRFWQNITSQRDYLAAKDKAVRAIKKAFDREGITIPFPIRTLDFGVVGGERLDNMYPIEAFNNSNSKN
ncbi:MAG: mechanosensitive ion channel family protein [Saprospiraceae bacterium]|nr:mechanosensitive ion channel family protein [Saprospiraceae bacterium]